jgi:hypothetical protein
MLTPSQEELRHNSTKEDQPEQLKNVVRGWLSPTSGCQTSRIWLADLQGNLVARSRRSMHRHHPVSSWWRRPNMGIHRGVERRAHLNTLGGWVAARATHQSRITTGNNLGGWVAARATHQSRITTDDTLRGWVTANTILEDWVFCSSHL